MSKNQKAGAVSYPDAYPGFLLETSDIDSYLTKRDKNFVGTYPKGDIPKIKKMMENKKYASSVINLSDGQGSHWVVLIKDNGNYYWIDPLGAVPPKIAIKQLKPLRYNKIIYQNATDATCGLWCIKIILHWKKNR